eukprot:NODE_5835_length_1730_cov_4.651279.p1 GENE.NODE_5835_length_1730_cov_4.651279~~NODE_5835_length_1730_cov_4.651279.p1  ORF type:complete len:438 (+),score=119.81 NODE_5835_length_1730_cov_4.651279:175-1488(+)
MSRYLPHPWPGEPVASLEPAPGEREALRCLLFDLLEEIEDGEHGDDFSIYTGRGGISYMYLLLSRNAALPSGQRDNCEDRARHWFREACALKPFYRGGMSFLLGSAGLHVLGCVLGRDDTNTKGLMEAEADAPSGWHARHLDAFATAAERGARGGGPVGVLRTVAPSVCDMLSLGSCGQYAPASEVLFGQAGCLYAMLHANALLEASGRQPAVPCEHVARAAEALFAAGRVQPRTKYSNDAPLVYTCFDDELLGAAHGLIGIVYMLLHTVVATAPELREAVDFIIKQQSESGGLPAVLGEVGDGLVHWCHGAPGLVFLLCRAYAVWRDPQHLQAALLAGEHTWHYGLLTKGVSLCHGTAGNGYALLRLWRTTGDAHWLSRARCFGLFVADRATYIAHRLMRVPDHPLSLYEGIAGAVCFAADLLRPEAARFPGFELS